MQPRIELLAETTLAGQHRAMSLLANTTAGLWQGFMQRLRARPFGGSAVRYSVQLYEPSYFESFSPATTFEKWAAVAVASPANVPADLETLILPGGLYAVFRYQGPASAGAATFRYIMESWLPASGYVLDERPHFEMLDDKYLNEDPTSEEEIWVPISLRLAGTA